MKQVKGIGDKGLIRVIDGAERILLTGHISPDGDCIGSMLCMASLLEKRGKKVGLCLQDGVPARYRFLKGADRILPPESHDGASFDLGLALDCADRGRMGSAVDLFDRCPVTAQMDHHASNPRYAAVNEVDGGASCTGCMVWRLMGAWGAVPDASEAEALYCALSTDTGRFCFSCTDEETFLCASDLARTGFDISSCARRVHLVKEEPHLRLLGRCLSAMRSFAGGRCTSVVIGEEDYLSSGAGREHSDGIINYALNIPGVRMTYMADLSERSIVRVSFRAVEPCHVDDIAALFGGGGHRLAAGCRTAADSGEVFRRIEEAMEKQLKELGEMG